MVVTMLNYTEIDRKLSNVDFVVGSSPRWYFMGKVRNEENPRLNTSVTIIFLNSSKELQIGLGRDFPQRALKNNVSINFIYSYRKLLFLQLL